MKRKKRSYVKHEENLKLTLEILGLLQKVKTKTAIILTSNTWPATNECQPTPVLDLWVFYRYK